MKTFNCTLFLLLATCTAIPLHSQIAYPVLASVCGNPISMGDSPNLIAPFGDELAFFTQNGSSNRILYTTNGVPGGRVEIAAANAANDLNLAVRTDSAWYFKEKRDGQWTISEWATGTDTLVPIYWAPTGLGIDYIVGWENALYFDLDEASNDSYESLVRLDLTSFATDTLFSSDFGGIRGIGTLDEAVMFLVNTNEGKMLARTDGSAEGTEVVKQLYEPGSEFAGNPLMRSNGQQLFFFYHPNNDPYNFWVTDGTTEGTQTLGAYEAATLPGGNAAFLDDRLIFIAKEVGTPSGFTLELHVSDGTPEGTFSLNADPSVYLHPRLLTPYNDRLYFCAIPGSFWHLYSTDGTTNGTVQEINGGATYRNIFHLGTFQDSLVFTAYLSDYGEELFISDGTQAGTRLVQDIVPGSDHSTPYDFVEAGGKLFFLVTTPAGAKQLWVYHPELAEIPSSNLTISSSEIVDAIDGAPGSISIMVSGGTPPYQFQLNGGSPSDTAYFDQLEAGDYTLTVTDQNGCTVEATYTVEMVTGLREHSALTDWKVYPNPVANGDVVTLNFASVSPLHPRLLLVDATGKILQDRQLGPGQNWREIITLNTTASGVYFLVLIHDGKQLVRQALVVEQKER